MKKAKYIREIEIRFRKRRVKADSPVEEFITDPQQVVELFSDLQNESKEKMITISLTRKLKMISFELIAIGSIRSIFLRPFEAIRAAIALNADGIIILHNHPSGDPSPSKEDEEFTKKLNEITSQGGLNFHDHIIVGDQSYFSFSEEGLLK